MKYGAVVIAALLILLAGRIAFPQPQAEPAVNAHRHFEVASIKPSKPGAGPQDLRINFPPGRYEALNVTIKDLLSAMSGFAGRVEGGPKWVETDRYDISAKAEGDIGPSERNEIVMTLLQDRFKLITHHDGREQSGFALLVGNAPPNLSRSKDGEETVIRRTEHAVVFQAVSMARLAIYLRQLLLAPVVNRTGIKEQFDFTLDLNSNATKVSAEDPARQDSFADLVRTAIEQFGLKLEAQKIIVNVTIIDHIERPTEN